MVKVSFIMISARDDHPYTNRPDLHVFEPTLECFKNQTMTDFEWVVVDVLYEQRKNYFKDLNLPFKVKHVPALPNLWIQKGFCGVSTQYNKGIIYADGELCFFTGDSHMVQPDFMENLWTRYQQGYFPLAWYMYDHSFSDPLPTSGRLDIETAQEKYAKAYPEQGRTPIPYNILGYDGRKVSIEHRYTKTFGENPERTMVAPVHWEWWFGCSSASLEAMLNINGFNQNFDGDRMLLDCDVGSRLDLAGYSVRFALFKDIFLIRAPTDASYWNPTLNKKGGTIKCNYPLIWYNRCWREYQANTKKLSEQDIRWIKEVWCAKNCPIRELCKREHPWQYPFEHKDGYAGHDSKKEWFDFWQSHQTTINLTEERQKRLNGEKYQEGTFV